MSRRFVTHTSRDGRVFIFDNEFGYDAKLSLDGDFATPRHRLEYAQAVAAALNAAPIPTPDTSQWFEDGTPKADWQPPTQTRPWDPVSGCEK